MKFRPLLTLSSNLLCLFSLCNFTKLTVILTSYIKSKDRHDAIVQEVHSLSQHAAKSFSFPKYGDLRTPTGDDGRTPDGLIRGLTIKPLYLDVTIGNPTSITYI